MKMLERILQFFCYGLAVVAAVLFIKYSAWEKRLLSDEYSAPLVSSARVIPYEIKSKVAYVTLAEKREIDVDIYGTFGCFLLMVFCGGFSYFIFAKK